MPTSRGIRGIRGIRGDRSAEAGKGTSRRRTKLVNTAKLYKATKKHNYRLRRMHATAKMRATVHHVQTQPAALTSQWQGTMYLPPPGVGPTSRSRSLRWAARRGGRGLAPRERARCETLYPCTCLQDNINTGSTVKMREAKRTGWGGIAFCEVYRLSRNKGGGLSATTSGMGRHFVRILGHPDTGSTQGWRLH